VTLLNKSSFRLNITQNMEHNIPFLHFSMPYQKTHYHGFSSYLAYAHLLLVRAALPNHVLLVAPKAKSIETISPTVPKGPINKFPTHPAVSN